MKTIEESQAKAKEIGHCLCHMKIQCPCNVFITKKKCKCSGDTSISHEEWLKINGVEK